jgi:hypothetical protein
MWGSMGFSGAMSFLRCRLSKAAYVAASVSAEPLANLRRPLGCLIPAMRSCRWNSGTAARLASEGFLVVDMENLHAPKPAWPPATKSPPRQNLFKTSLHRDIEFFPPLKAKRHTRRAVRQPECGMAMGAIM